MSRFRYGSVMSLCRFCFAVAAVGDGSAAVHVRGVAAAAAAVAAAAAAAAVAAYARPPQSSRTDHSPDTQLSCTKHSYQSQNVHSR